MRLLSQLVSMRTNPYDKIPYKVQQNFWAFNYLKESL